MSDEDMKLGLRDLTYWSRSERDKDVAEAALAKIAELERENRGLRVDIERRDYTINRMRSDIRVDPISGRRI